MAGEGVEVQSKTMVWLGKNSFCAASNPAIVLTLMPIGEVHNG